MSIEKNILITGANGFLGQAILTQLKESGASVYATDLLSTGAMPDCVYCGADITKPDELKSLLKNISKVIHVAGLAHIFSPNAHLVERFKQVNETGTANMATAAAEAGVEHFILISSVSVYGPHTNGVYNENYPCKPVGAYAISKHNAELRAIEIAQESGMALTIFRLATLYGEGDPGNVSRLVRSIDKGRFLWIGDGSNRKSLLYKGDAARACAVVLDRPASGVNIYNVSAPTCTMREIVDGMAGALGKRPFPLQFPAAVALFLSRSLSCIPISSASGLYKTVKKWLAEDVYDTSRFEEAYGFKTKTSLKEGLKREVDWFKCNTLND